MERHEKVYRRVTVAILADHTRKVLRNGFLEKWRLSHLLAVCIGNMGKSARTDISRSYRESFGEKAATRAKLKQRQPQGARENRPEHLHIETAWRQ